MYNNTNQGPIGGEHTTNLKHQPIRYKNTNQGPIGGEHTTNIKHQPIRYKNTSQAPIGGENKKNNNQSRVNWWKCKTGKISFNKTWGIVMWKMKQDAKTWKPMKKQEVTRCEPMKHKDTRWGTNETRGYMWACKKRIQNESQLNTRIQHESQ